MFIYTGVLKLRHSLLTGLGLSVTFEPFSSRGCSLLLRLFSLVQSFHQVRVLLVQSFVILIGHRLRVECVMISGLVQAGDLFQAERDRESRVENTDKVSG